MRSRTIIIVASFSAFSIAPADAAPSADARLLASQCAQCHGTNGYSVGGINSLAGSEYFDLRDKMIDLNRPTEIGSIMKHQAKGYTRAQIDLIAAYFASLPKK